VSAVDERPTPASDADEELDRLLERLNRQSAIRGSTAYGDIEWEDPAFAVDADDLRFALPAFDSLTRTPWYRSLAPEVRSRLGLYSAASKFKVGEQFENAFKQGLLRYLWKLPTSSAEGRYVYHEIIEEAQHSLMFREFIARSAPEVKGIQQPWRSLGRVVSYFGRFCPSLFFVFVLAGEDPLDNVQRTSLREGGRHPLVERIMRIHVSEEARHLSFSRQWLATHHRRARLPGRVLTALGAPLIVYVMMRLTLLPARDTIRRFRIPRSARRQAYRHDAEGRRFAAACLTKLWSTCERAGMQPWYSRPLWWLLGRRFGLSGGRDRPA
jgi:hypothetical protein